MTLRIERLIAARRNGFGTSSIGQVIVLETAAWCRSTVLQYHVLQLPYCVTVQVAVQGHRTVTVACSEVQCHALLVNSRSRLTVAP